MKSRINQLFHPGQSVHRNLSFARRFIGVLHLTLEPRNERPAGPAIGKHQILLRATAEIVVLQNSNGPE
jgi:hypothetical protein